MLIWGKLLIRVIKNDVITLEFSEPQTILLHKHIVDAFFKLGKEGGRGIIVTNSYVEVIDYYIPKILLQGQIMKVNFILNAFY